MKEFFNLYRHGFARMAVATPLVRVGDPQYNLDATVELMRTNVLNDGVQVDLYGPKEDGIGFGLGFIFGPAIGGLLGGLLFGMTGRIIVTTAAEHQRGRAGRDR